MPSDRRVSLSRNRYEDLLRAAVWGGCRCMNDSSRVHDGKCISCWALDCNIERVRGLLEGREVESPTLRDVLEVYEGERGFRATWIEKLRKEAEGG